MGKQLCRVNKIDNDNDHASKFIPSIDKVVITVICIGLLITEYLVTEDGTKLVYEVCTALAINILISPPLHILREG